MVAGRGPERKSVSLELKVQDASGTQTMTRCCLSASLLCPPVLAMFLDNFSPHNSTPVPTAPGGHGLQVDMV